MTIGIRKLTSSWSRVGVTCFCCKLGSSEMILISKKSFCSWEIALFFDSICSFRIITVTRVIAETVWPHKKSDSGLNLLHAECLNSYRQNWLIANDLQTDDALRGLLHSGDKLNFVNLCRAQQYYSCLQFGPMFW